MSECPDLEVLFTELAEGGGLAVDHARDCPHCAMVLEEHRQLEKDLFRLADPLPPPDFLQSVMAKVAAQPAPARADLKTAAGILIFALAVLGLSLAVGQVGLGSVGVRIASSIVGLRELGVGFTSALAMVWKTAALPLLVTLLALLLSTLVGLRRLGAPAYADLKVS